MSDYTKSGKPLDGARNIAKVIRDEFTLIETATNSKSNKSGSTYTGTHDFTGATISSGQLDAKAPLASPALTGTPTAPTAVAGTNTTQLATTAHVFAERSNSSTLTNKTLTTPVISSPTGIVKGDVGLGNVDNTTDASKPISTATQTALDLKSPLASPTFTGVPAAPTAAPGTNTTQLATTAFVDAKAFSTALPSQTGNNGKFVTTDGSVASWASAAILGANTFTAAQNTAYATVVSHATTADIWGAAGNIISWTGTATTTAFPNAPQAGSERVLICAGLSSFTAGANLLIDGVASGNTFACAVNDRITVTAVSTTQFRLSIDKYDGTSIVAGAGLIYLSTVTASASATVDIETTFDSTYDEYMIVATGVVAATDATVLILRMKIGGSYLATATYSYHVSTPNSSASSYNGLGLDAQTEVSLTQNNSNASDEPVNLCIRVHNPASTTTKKTVDWQGSNFHATAPTFSHITGAAVNTGTGALTGIRILSTSGNIASGTFRLYGIKKS